jgi:hypothetical protein
LKVGGREEGGESRKWEEREPSQGGVSVGSGRKGRRVRKSGGSKCRKWEEGTKGEKVRGE